jgi:hypothetical protein
MCALQWIPQTRSVAIPEEPRNVQDEIVKITKQNVETPEGTTEGWY